MSIEKLSELKHLAMPTLSNKYQTINTIQAIQPLISRGYEVTNVSLRKVSKKNLERTGHQFHVLRLRKTSDLRQVGDSFPEIVISNSYDGTSSLVVRFGLYRLVCANGLVVGSDLVAPIFIRHVGRDLEHRVLYAVAKIESESEKIETLIAKGEKIGVIEPMNFATNLIKGQFEGLEKLTSLPINRAGDLNNSWTVFNLVQENLLSRGGIRGIFKIVNSETGEIEYKEKSLRVKRGTVSALESNVKLFNEYNKFLMAA